jgi:hypothetical protein
MNEIIEFSFIILLFFLIYISFLTGTFILYDFKNNKIDFVENNYNEISYNVNFQYTFHLIMSIILFPTLIMFVGMKFGKIIGWYSLLFLIVLTFLIRFLLYKTKIISITYNSRGPITIFFKNNNINIILSPMSNKLIMFSVLMIIIWYTLLNKGIIKL